MKANRMKTHRKDWKIRQVQVLSPLFKKYKTIGVGDLSGMPASLIQKLRKNLNGKAVLKVSKTRVVKKALATVPSKKNVDEIINKSCLMIYSDLDPFELFALIKKNQSKAFAREGYIAEEDIIVPAGDTGLPPGPALSELKAAGLAIKIQGPTIQVTDDKVVAKKGTPVTKPVAAVLSKLDIKPVKVGLKMNGVFYDGAYFRPEVLNIDTDEVFENFVKAYRQSLNLAVNAHIFIKESMPLLLGKAYREAKEVAMAAKVFSGEETGKDAEKASREAGAQEASAEANPAEAVQPQGDA